MLFAKLALPLLVALAFASQVLARPVQFTPAEIEQHRQNIEIITSTAQKCLEDTYADHIQFFQRWHVSKYYGDRKREHQTAAGRRAQLKKFGAPESLEPQLHPISCIGLTVNCLGQGFEAAGQAATWAKIYARLEADQFLGTELQQMLRDLGWQTLYWNPDPSQNAAWDQEDRRLTPLARGQSWMPVWGAHAARYATALRRHNYAGIDLDDVTTLVGFGNRPPQIFRDQPFFVGTAHAGYHVFPGFDGKVIEAHSARELNSIDNLQVSEFNPLSPTGGPKWTRTEKYRSGVIVVPPGVLNHR